MRVESAEDRVHDGATDILETHVDTVWTKTIECGSHILGLVDDGTVEAEVLDEPAALLGSARDTDYAAALDLRDLSDDRATAPAAAETTRVSPGCGRQMSVRPK